MRNDVRCLPSRNTSPTPALHSVVLNTCARTLDPDAVGRPIVLPTSHNVGVRCVSGDRYTVAETGSEEIVNVCRTGTRFCVSLRKRRPGAIRLSLRYAVRVSYSCTIQTKVRTRDGRKCPSVVMRAKH